MKRHYGTDGVSRNDPDAVEKLEARLAALQKHHEAMKAENRQARIDGVTPPHPDWEIGNSNCIMRYTKLRIKKLTMKQATTERRVNGVLVVENVEDARLQLFFDNPPTPELQEALNGYGFQQSANCWEARLNDRSRWRADRILERI